MKDVVFTVTTATRTKSPAPLLRKIEKAVSFVLLSVQLRLTWLADMAVAARLVGAAGTADGVLSVASLLQPEVPPSLNARTRYV